MFADPLNDTPPIVLAFSRIVADAALPVISSLAVINPAPFVSWLVFVNEVVIYPAPLVS